MPPVDPGHAQPPLVLVLDAGSSSLRAALYDRQARPVAGCDARLPLHLTTGQDGAVELPPETFVDGFATVIDRVLVHAGRLAGGIGAVGMAAFAATVVGVDPAGLPVTPAFLYADTRPAEQARALRRELDAGAIHQRTGCRLHTSYLPARLRWLRETSPAAYHRARRWLALPDYLFLRLFGTAVTSLSLASWSGLLNRHLLSWDRGLLAHLELGEDRLPALTAEPLTGLLPEWAARWPALAGAPWFPAWGDGAASNIGSGCTGPARAALNIGTSAALRVVTACPPQTLPPGLWCYRVDTARALVGGALNEGGGAVAWARRVLQIGDMDRAEEVIARTEPDGHGLTVLPFLTGERSPGWNPELRFTLAGAGLATSAQDILQALMESVAYRLALVDRELARVAPVVEELVAGGGGATGAPVWLQIIADVLGRPVRLAAEPEATSHGAALLTLEAMGQPVAVPAPEAAALMPRAERFARYQAALHRHEGLYARLAEWHALDENGAG